MNQSEETKPEEILGYEEVKETIRAFDAGEISRRDAVARFFAAIGWEVIDDPRSVDPDLKSDLLIQTRELRIPVLIVDSTEGLDGDFTDEPQSMKEERQKIASSWGVVTSLTWSFWTKPTTKGHYGIGEYLVGRSKMPTPDQVYSAHVHLQTARAADDQPTTDDRLGFEETADFIAGIVRETVPSSMRVAVTGEWGSGKTSLMRMVEQRLNESGCGGRPLLVWFNAWQYQRDDGAVVRAGSRGAQTEQAAARLANKDRRALAHGVGARASVVAYRRACLAGRRARSRGRRHLLVRRWNLGRCGRVRRRRRVDLRDRKSDASGRNRWQPRSIQHGAELRGPLWIPQKLQRGLQAAAAGPHRLREAPARRVH